MSLISEKDVERDSLSDEDWGTETTNKKVKYGMPNIYQSISLSCET